MTEGIEFNPIGTVDVTFDDKTYHLGRPKLKQWKYFRGQMEKIFNDTRDRLAELGAAVAEATNAIEEAADPELGGVLELAKAEALKEDATKAHRDAREIAWQAVYDATTEALKAQYDDAKDALEKFAADPFYVRSSDLLKDMFAQVGDKLPDDIDEWPVWLATDTTLPGQILTHWQDRPKASSPTPPD